MTRQAKLEAIARVLIDDKGSCVADLSRKILEAIERGIDENF